VSISVSLCDVLCAQPTARRVGKNSSYHDARPPRNKTESRNLAVSRLVSVNVASWALSAGIDVNPASCYRLRVAPLCLLWSAGACSRSTAAEQRPGGVSSQPRGIPAEGVRAARQDRGGSAPLLHVGLPAARRPSAETIHGQESGRSRDAS